VDIVYIATPPDSHEEYALMAAAAGKPVYVEKPMARRYEECRRMISACREANVPLFVAYYRRRLPKFLKVRELLSEGAIGEVRAVMITFLQSPRPEVLGASQLPWRVRPEISGGGYFVDLGSHQLDLLDYYFGPIAEVEGRVANQGGMYPAEDLVTAQFRFEGGIAGEGLWCFTAAQAAESDRTEIIGTDGTLTFSIFDPSPIRLVTAAGLSEIAAPWPDHVHLPLVQTIVDELLGRGTCPSTGETGARTSLAIDRVLGYQS
jgi:predicted dehydrogenase